MRCCAIIPTYNHQHALPRLVHALASQVEAVLLVDDGSGDDTKDALAALAAAEPRVEVLTRAKNGGKGAAVKTGLLRAAERGFTHALQIDADGQHELAAVARLLAEAEKRPEAVILGAPVFDESVPKGRLHARRICQFWVNVETRGRVIEDPMCGLRVYPVAAALAAGAAGDRMEFDPEIAVRMVWRGAEVVNVPVRVHYPEAGTSHFRMVEDNLRISWMHSKLMTLLVLRLLFGWMWR